MAEIDFDAYPNDSTGDLQRVLDCPSGNELESAKGEADCQLGRFKKEHCNESLSSLDFDLIVLQPQNELLMQINNTPSCSFYSKLCITLLTLCQVAGLALGAIFVIKNF